MNNIMYFKAGDSRSIPCIINELPAIPRGQQRGEWTERPGLDGAQFETDDALVAADMPVNIYIPPTTDINQLIAWLYGSGKLRFNNWPWFWDAAIDAQLLLRPAPFNDGWNTTAIFKVQPYRYLYPEADTFTVQNGSIIQNPCTGVALPIIRIEGSGNINLMIGNKTMIISNLNQPINIDCEAKIAYSDGIEAMMSGLISPVEGWPVLNAENTAISWTGSITELSITPRWRWL